MTNQNNWEEGLKEIRNSITMASERGWGRELEEMLDIFLGIPGKNLYKATDIIPFILKIEADAERRGVEKCIEVLEGRITSWEDKPSDGIWFIKRLLLNTPPNEPSHRETSH